jgi:hypothetical protein
MTGVETDNAVFTHINPQECFDCDVWETALINVWWERAVSFKRRYTLIQENWLSWLQTVVHNLSTVQN